MDVSGSPQKQSDRTANTRAAILEATVALLGERGYASTSTRLAAERAGISLGALQHHFRTKAELSVEAMRFVTDRLAREFVAATPLSGDELTRYEEILDRLWIVFRGPSSAAGVEIQMAARTDTDLQEPVRQLHEHINKLIHESAGELLPEMAASPEFPAFFQLTLSSLRGLASTSFDPLLDVDPEWLLVRSQLISTARRLTQ